MRFGAAAKLRPGNEPVLGVAGHSVASSGIEAMAPQDPSAAVAATSVAERLMVDLFQKRRNGPSVGLTVASLPGGTILDLELAALEVLVIGGKKLSQARVL